MSGKSTPLNAHTAHFRVSEGYTQRGKLLTRFLGATRELNKAIRVVAKKDRKEFERPRWANFFDDLTQTRSARAEADGAIAELVAASVRVNVPQQLKGDQNATNRRAGKFGQTRKFRDGKALAMGMERFNDPKAARQRKDEVRIAFKGSEFRSPTGLYFGNTAFRDSF
jgi:hypothetical protein